MTKDEALRLALEAFEMFCEHGAILRPIETRDAIKAALEAKDELVCVCGAVWEGQELVIAPPEEAKDEIDWRDMYEKQKRHTEMWVAKYEKDIGPLEKAVPHQEAKDEPVAWVYPEFWQHLENLNCGTAYRLSGIGRQPLYTTPPQRTWVGLTDEDEIDWDGGDLKSLIAAIEAKLKEKNT